MFDELRKTFSPPYNIKDLYSIFISIFIMLSIPLTVLQITSIRDSRTSASTQTPGDFKVSINSLSQNGVASGSVNIEVEAINNNSSIVSVSLVVDEQIVSTNNNQSTSNKMITSFSWDTTKVHNGTRSIKAVATNSLGGKQTSTTYKVTVVNNDSQKPTISFVQPSDGDYINGSSYKVTLQADDNFTLEKITLKIDGKEVRSFTSVPFEYDWNISNVVAGSHTLEATATDSSGNSSAVSIGVYKAAKTPTD